MPSGAFVFVGDAGGGEGQPADGAVSAAEGLVEEAGALAALGVALGVVPAGEHVGVDVGVDLQTGRCAVDGGGVV